MFTHTVIAFCNPWCTRPSARASITMPRCSVKLPFSYALNDFPLAIPYDLLHFLLKNFIQSFNLKMCCKVFIGFITTGWKEKEGLLNKFEVSSTTHRFFLGSGRDTLPLDQPDKEEKVTTLLYYTDCLFWTIFNIVYHFIQNVLKTKTRINIKETVSISEHWIPAFSQSNIALVHQPYEWIGCSLVNFEFRHSV